jgi:hypothetical protein
MNEKRKNVGETFAISSHEQREKIEIKKAKISSLVLKNSEAILQGLYTINDLVNDSGDFTSATALGSFLFSQYGHANNLLEVAKNLKEVDKISEPEQATISAETKPAKTTVDVDGIKMHFFKLLDNKKTKKAAMDELRLMIQNKQLPEEGLIFSAFEVKTYKQLKDSLFAQWELKKLSK